MKSSQVTELLRPLDAVAPEVDSNLAIDKLACLLDVGSLALESDIQVEDLNKTASTMEKLAKALESGQARLDLGLRELFGGDDSDEEILRHNQIEDEYQQVSGT